MTRKNYYLIPVLIAVVLIPQCLFWWLAPTEASARLVVYIGGTLLSSAIPVASLKARWSRSLPCFCGLTYL